MKAKITIEDDFDLEKIAVSGQVFRVKRFDDGTYRFITGDDVLYIRKADESDAPDGRSEGESFEISCDNATWERVWEPYFDLGRSYEDVRKRAQSRSGFVDRALDDAAGLRVLRQDAWEMLITFIISQRKNMPAIAKAVELISEHYGIELRTPLESVHAFPTVEALAGASEKDLRDLGLGYRAPYILDAATKVASGKLSLENLAELGDEELDMALQQVKGVGAKVSNCISLFAYGRTRSVPVDVWIARAMAEHMEDDDPFAAFGDDAGIIQQYIFYHMTQTVRRQ